MSYRRFGSASAVLDGRLWGILRWRWIEIPKYGREGSPTSTSTIFSSPGSRIFKIHGFSQGPYYSNGWRSLLILIQLLFAKLTLIRQWKVHHLETYQQVCLKRRDLPTTRSPVQYIRARCACFFDGSSFLLDGFVGRWSPWSLLAVINRAWGRQNWFHDSVQVKLDGWKSPNCCKKMKCRSLIRGKLLFFKSFLDVILLMQVFGSGFNH